MSVATEPPKTRYTPEEYIAREEAAEYKSEYWNGEIFAMAGGSREHNQIMGTLFSDLYVFLEGKECRPFNSETRVKVRAIDRTLYTYPDITVVCGEPDWSDESKTATLLNPTIVIEVLSPSTARWDRTRKSKAYRLLPSLKECVLISQDYMHAEVLRRTEEGWLYEDFDGRDASFVLRTIGFACPLSRIYRDVDAPDSLPDRWAE